jgi:hypothetical protein
MSSHPASQHRPSRVAAEAECVTPQGFAGFAQVPRPPPRRSPVPSRRVAAMPHQPAKQFAGGRGFPVHRKFSAGNPAGT